jgi:hypothetical protein
MTACLRGFEPPTFGSGVPFPIFPDIWENPISRRVVCVDKNIGNYFFDLQSFDAIKLADNTPIMNR